MRLFCFHLNLLFLHLVHLILQFCLFLLCLFYLLVHFGLSLVLLFLRLRLGFFFFLLRFVLVLLEVCLLLGNICLSLFLFCLCFLCLELFVMLRFGLLNIRLLHFLGGLGDYRLSSLHCLVGVVFCFLDSLLGRLFSLFRLL